MITYQDGVFELVVTKNKSFWSLLGLTYDFYMRRNHPKHFVLLPGKHFTVNTPDKLSMQIDGELLPQMNNLEIHVLSNKQQFIIP